jgi:hypothetical protein
MPRSYLEYKRLSAAVHCDYWHLRSLANQEGRPRRSPDGRPGGLRAARARERAVARGGRGHGCRRG